MRIIPIFAVGGDTFYVLHKQFFVDTVSLKAFAFLLFDDLIPIVEVVKIKPFRA